MRQTDGAESGRARQTGTVEGRELTVHHTWLAAAPVDQVEVGELIHEPT